MMLTKKEILKLLKNESVFLGRNPERTFEFYEENGLLPVSEGFRDDSPLYPDHTPWVFKDILFAQQVEKRTLQTRFQLNLGTRARVSLASTEC